MNINFANLNYLAIGILVLINVVLAMLWYSPIMFGKPWAAITGQSIIGPPDAKKILIGIITNAAIVLTIAILTNIIGINDLKNAFTFAGILSIGIVCSTILPIYVYNGYSIKLFIIDAGLAVSFIFISSIVLSIWK